MKKHNFPHFFKISLISIATWLLFASGVSAVGGIGTSAGQPANFRDLVSLILNNILTPLVALIMGLSLLGFLWGAAEFIWKADSEEARKKGSQKMLYGIIALFVMISVWGIVKILTTTFGIDFAVPQLMV